MARVICGCWASSTTDDEHATASFFVSFVSASKPETGMNLYGYYQPGSTYSTWMLLLLLVFTFTPSSRKPFSCLDPPKYTWYIETHTRQIAVLHALAEPYTMLHPPYYRLNPLLRKLLPVLWRVSSSWTELVAAFENVSHQEDEATWRLLRYRHRLITLPGAMTFYNGVIKHSTRETANEEYPVVADPAPYILWDTPFSSIWLRTVVSWIKSVCPKQGVLQRINIDALWTNKPFKRTKKFTPQRGDTDSPTIVQAVLPSSPAVGPTHYRKQELK